jgi:hypothetical protein
MCPTTPTLALFQPLTVMLFGSHTAASRLNNTVSSAGPEAALHLSHTAARPSTLSAAFTNAAKCALRSAIPQLAEIISGAG